MEILAFRLFSPVPDGRLCHAFKGLFHDIFSRKVLLASCPPLRCTGTLCAASQRQPGTKFWIIQTQPASSMDCFEHSWVLVSLPGYMFIVLRERAAQPTAPVFGSTGCSLLLALLSPGEPLQSCKAQDLLRDNVFASFFLFSFRLQGRARGHLFLPSPACQSQGRAGHLPVTFWA